MPVESLQTPAKVIALPPLILHPFADAGGPDRLAESSRANLMLHGLLPAGDRSPDDLQRELLSGRYSEIRMLYYIGRDLMRWMDQCLDLVKREPGESGENATRGAFARLLIHDAPESVRGKLQRWGVADYKSIFGRAIGLNLLFADLPPRNLLADDFLRHYYRFTDDLFASFQKHVRASSLDSLQFSFDLYSSGEYARMLERFWDQ